MGQRREIRLQFALPVTITGTDTSGERFSESAETVDMTAVGVQITGLSRALRLGAVVEVQHKAARARYRVAWIGDPGSPRAGHVGMQLVDTGKNIWGRTLPRVYGDAYLDPDRTWITK